ncbi:hypothetical protein M513_02055 [Trichuris suis]|uniref:Uncharacterized protein n=1 Tax=Trichuris suis TaxID=68888 RepID=A0A085MIX4_9BILA|nr:hypothetical protein M513_02055 [Trichuris suis]
MNTQDEKSLSRREDAMGSKRRQTENKTSYTDFQQGLLSPNESISCKYNAAQRQALIYYHNTSLKRAIFIVHRRRVGKCNAKGEQSRLLGTAKEKIEKTSKNAPGPSEFPRICFNKGAR